MKHSETIQIHQMVGDYKDLIQLNINKKNYHQDVYSMKKKKRKKEFVIKKTIITITMNIDLIS
jgi:transcription initiation factor IIF auxiliary subunit